MARRYAWIVAVNLVLLAVFAEIAGIVLYYVDTGAFFYTHQKSYAPIEDAPEGRLTGDALHPYFGPTHAPGIPLQIPEELRDGPAGATDPANPTGARTNNFGFVSAYDYPFVRRAPNQFLVGIFGGSVGAWFCHVGAPRLAATLRAQPFFADKEIVPLCFSHEGYKQPQQVLALTYFLSIGQPFDLVINIDGFNEVALAPLNQQRGIDISMPSPMHLDGLVNLLDRTTMTPERLDAMARIQGYRRELNALADRLRQTRFAAVHAVLDRYETRTRSLYAAELGRLANLPGSSTDTSLIRVTPSVTPRDEQRLFEDIASQWAQSSLMMHTILAERDIPYFHILQPNQYFTTRRFSDSERQTAVNDASPFKTGAARGYPALIAASASLATKERFFNGVGIFDREASPVYIDDCCHYTLVGNQRLADFIAASILGAAGPWREQGPDIQGGR